jgi:hypothetical protein
MLRTFTPCRRAVKRRRWSPAVVTAIGAGTVVVALLAAVVASWIGLQRTNPQRASALASYQQAVLRDLSAPSTAQFFGVHVAKDSLSEDDYVWLGFDADRARSVWSVTGDVASQGASGDSVRSGFVCRAVLFGGSDVRTSTQYATADVEGQRAPRR